MRLIDADELIKSYLDHNRTEFEIKNCCMANENVIAIINNAPTVERPQGEWIRKVDETGFISHICSECGAEIEVEDPKDDKFCFNCGAEMRGEENV